MIDNNDLRSFSLLTHFANVTIREITAFAPRTLVTIGANLAADISGKLEVEGLKIARKRRVGVIANVDQARKFTVLGIELYSNPLVFQAIKAEVVSHPLHQCRVKVFDVLLHKRNVFIKELLLQRFISGADDGHFT